MIIVKGEEKRKMYVNFTDDEMYPISIEDGWDGKVYIHLWDIEDEKQWESFINDLNATRKEFLLKRKAIKNGAD